MKKTWLLVLLYMTIAFSAPLLRTVAANEEAEERELKIESENGQVKVDSQFENQSTENHYEITLSAEEGIRLDLHFNSHINATEYELELKVHFLQLIEFIDGNGDGVPNAGEEVQSVDLTQKAYSSPNVTQITSNDGKAGYRFESHLTGETYVFQIIGDIFPTNAVLNDTSVKPTEMKITIVIKDFPYKENGSLALMIEATSEKQKHMEEGTGDIEEDVTVKSATAEGYFSWSKEALIDGVSKEVRSSVVNTENGKLITLSYPNGKDIVHDPKLGISLLASVAGLPWIYIAAGAAIVALAVAVGIRVFRPKMPGLAFLRAYLT